MDPQQDSTAAAQDRRRIALLMAAHFEAESRVGVRSDVALLERPADADHDETPAAVTPADPEAEDVDDTSLAEEEAEAGPETADEEPAAEKPRKKKKRDEADAAPLGTSKAVETMFRNAIRGELDIIALAATKANIMISLNGFIISALMISGAFLFNSSPSFLVPAAVFILTSAGSITFALLAASPERANSLESLKEWWRDRKAGEATWSDLSGYLMRGSATTHASGDQRNLLIYEDRVQVSHDDFWGEMQVLLRDRDEIYRQMSDHLYWLGKMANRKFKLLNVSYSVFRWGLVASIATFLLIKSTVWAFPALADDKDRAVPNFGIAEFSDIYEPSAVQQMPDGRILVVEDEASRAVNILTFGDDGRLVEDNALDLKVTRGFGRTLSDLEGLSVDDDGFIYAITSHSPTKKDDRKPEREQLLRFQIKGGQVGDIGSYTGLHTALGGAEALKASILEKTGEEIDFDEINIEGLSFHKATGQLLLGMRSPMVGADSLIIVIENPEEVLAGSAAPQFGEPIVLDLQGGGIRALSYDPVLGSFLIVNEIEDAEGDKMSQMWSWTGDPADPPTALEMPGMIDLNNVESVDSVTVGGEDRLLIMSDEGDPKKDRPAKYLLLDYAQLPAL